MRVRPFAWVFSQQARLLRLRINTSPLLRMRGRPSKSPRSNAAHRAAAVGGRLRYLQASGKEGFLHFSAQQWEQWPAGPYLILARSDGWLLGSTGLGFQTPHEAMTGYVLAKDAWGHGYATEALTAMINVAPRIAVSHLYALCHPEHRPSWRVLEKCGFTHDDTATRRTEFPNLDPGVQQDALCYVLDLEAEKDYAG